MGLLPDTWNCGLCMRRECRVRFPCHRLQRKPLVTDPGMHHDTCVTHVPWCMSGSLTRSGGENVPGIPGTSATRDCSIWQEPHEFGGKLQYTVGLRDQWAWLLFSNSQSQSKQSPAQHWRFANCIFGLYKETLKMSNCLAYQALQNLQNMDTALWPEVSGGGSAWQHTCDYHTDHRLFAATSYQHVRNMCIMHQHILLPS